MSKIRALGYMVLVKVEKQEEMSKGGIVIPETVREQERRAVEVGTVLEVGPVAWRAESLGGYQWVESGDRILFAKYSGKWVKDPHDPDGEELLMIRDEDVVGRIDE